MPQGNIDRIDLPLCQIGEYDALCENEYGAVCTGTDLRIIQQVQCSQTHPIIIGHETIGRVIKMGRKVTSFKEGDLVSGVYLPDNMYSGYNMRWGGFSQYGIVTDYCAMQRDGAISNNIERYKGNQVVPNDIEAADAVMLISWRESFAYIKKLGISQGMSILIIGSGTMALSFAAQLATMDVSYSVVGNRAQEHRFRTIGYLCYYDYKYPYDACKWGKGGGQQYDIIIDTVGDRDYIKKYSTFLKPMGTYAVFGLKHNFSSILKNNTYQWVDSSWQFTDAHENVIQLIRMGALKSELWIDDSIYPFEEFNNALEDLKKKKAFKALIKIK